MRGRVEVIGGCMASGKTAALIGRLSHLEASGARVVAIKHAVDVRDSRTAIVSRTGARRDAVVVTDSGSIIELSANYSVLAIDETQFFGAALAAVVAELATAGRTVIASGLNIDAWNRPFTPLPEIARMADSVTILKGTCTVCRQAASFTQRVAPLTPADLSAGRTRLVGGAELFEPRCQDHFEPLTD